MCVARATTFIFDSQNGCSCECVEVFQTENVSTWLGHEPLIFGFLPNGLTIRVIRATHLLPHVFEYWLWWFKYFCSQFNIRNVNYAKATAFIFDARSDVLVKVSGFFNQKISQPEGGSNPNLRIHAKCSNHFSCHGQALAATPFRILL